jgi:hypothetical protein
MPHVHRHHQLLGHRFPSIPDPSLMTDELRAEAYAKTAAVMGELDKIRKRLELKPEQLDLVCMMYGGVLDTLLAIATTKANEASVPETGLEGAWHNIVGSMPRMPPPLMREDQGPTIREVFPVNSTAFLCPSCSTKHPDTGGRGTSSSLPYKIKPNERLCISARPQRIAFRPEQIEIKNADRWIVHDFKIGNRSQFSQGGDIPGDFFDGSASLMFETAQTAMDVTFDVTYIGPIVDGEQFVATITGTVAH